MSTCIDNRVAFFITPHGFGHAARASAVMDALRKADKETVFDIYTTVPEWFFKGSISGPFRYNHLCTDVGLVQSGALSEDPEKTLQALDRFFPFDSFFLDEAAKKLGRSGAGLVICDISAMGIAIARKAGIPSVLLENFTWDWIYESCRETHPGIVRHIDYLKEIYVQADHRIQAVPFCRETSADNSVSPISRDIRQPREKVRQSLGIPETCRLVLVTMGGFSQSCVFPEKAARNKDIRYLVTGCSGLNPAGNVIHLPRNSDFHHPDLVNAADAVVGKAGYSTLAEVYQAGVPFGFTLRTGFREAPVMEAFIEKEMKGFRIPESAFETGEWTEYVSELLEYPGISRTGPKGADQAARIISKWLKG